MKIGCCADLRNHELLLACKDAGVDYIEGSLAALHSMPQREVISLVHLLRDNSMQLYSFNGMFPTDIRLTGEWVDYQKIDSYLCEALEKASLFCPEIVVFGSSASRNTPPGFQTEYGEQQLCFLLQKHIAPIFARYGMRCAIEPLRPAEANIINTVAEGARLAKAANCSSVGLLADYYHMQQNGESASELLSLPVKPIHLHLASRDRKLPRPDDGTDYRALFDALKAIGYDGRISLECRVEQPYEQNLRASVDFLRSLA